MNHEDCVTADSDLEQGTSFCVYLPLSNTLASTEADEVNDRIIGGTEKILLVDDEEMIVQMEKTILESFGYRVKAFTQVTDLMQVFQQSPEWGDLIITDMTMPNMTGIELAKKAIYSKRLYRF